MKGGKLSKNKKYVLIIPLFLFIVLSFSITFADPTQNSNKIYINPFYRASMNSNTNYTYTININPPDGFSKSINSMITFQIYYSPTVTYQLWVDDKSCNNPSFIISTTYAGAGMGYISFDCSNIIKSTGTYSITLRADKNSGASYGWLDLTYMNNPNGMITVKGTEYYINDDGTLFVQLTDDLGRAINTATCTVSIYSPNTFNLTKPVFIENALMLKLAGSQGIYYYDFITPTVSGLYIAEAICQYEMTGIQIYPAYSFFKPIRNETYGTYFGDTIVLNDYSDWLYTQCTSQAVGGQKICDSNYLWNISYITDADSITNLHVSYFGESSSSPTMLFYVWNWTNSNWIGLTNSLLFHGSAGSGVPSGIDEYVSNNIPDLNNTIRNGTIKIRTVTSGGATFNLFSNGLYLIATSYEGVPHELKGSGEIHISSFIPSEMENRFFHILSCDGFLDGRCGYFTNDGEFDLVEGEIEDNISIIADASRSDISVNYITSPFVDCSALYWIKIYNGTEWEELEKNIDYTLYSQPSEENCLITIHQDISSGYQYDYWLKMDNYLKWEVDYSKQIFNATSPSINELCSNRNFTYTVPITESSIIPDDILTKYCYYIMDDYYWIDLYFNETQDLNITGEYVSYVQELRFYREELNMKYTFLSLENTSKLPNMIWNYKNRTLTYYPPELDMTNYSRIFEGVWNYTSRVLTYYPEFNYTAMAEAVWDFNNRTLTFYPDVNETAIAEAVWNFTNRILTYYPNQTDLTNYTKIQEDVWNYTNRILTYYPEINKTGIAESVWNFTERILTRCPCNKTEFAEEVWLFNNRILTYYPNQTDLTNYTKINEGVWNFTDRLLTYYPSLNETQIVEDVWNYTDRILTFYPDVNETIIAEATWNYTDRILTYYPDQIDMTNYTKINEGVWTYNNRTLTFFPISEIAEAVWSYFNRTLTEFFFDLQDIAESVWNYESRNLTYYPPCQNCTSGGFIISNCIVNDTFIGQNETARLQCTVLCSNPILYAEGLVEGYTYPFLNAGDIWYYDFLCEVGNQGVYNWTHFTATNDQNQNGTYIPNIIFECNFTNYAPNVLINKPLNGTIINLPYNINISTSDNNNDEINVSLYLFKNSIINTTIATGLPSGDYVYNWSGSIAYDNYELVLMSCETTNPDHLCSNDTNEILVVECASDWIAVNNLCNASDQKLISYTDLNGCINPYPTVPTNNGTYTSCNYCSEQLYYTDSSCINGTATRTYVDYNYASCCAVTNLPSDCSVDYSPYNESYQVECTLQDMQLSCQQIPNFELMEKEYCIAVLPENYTNETFKCISIIKNDANEIIQTNPEYVDKTGSLIGFSSEIDKQEYFSPQNRIVNFYFTQKNMLPKYNYTLELQCSSSERTLTSSQPLLMDYNDLSGVFDRTQWLKENPQYIIGGGVLATIITVGGYLIWILI